MKTSPASLFLLLLTSESTYVQGLTCKAQAAEKRLAGAAMTRFMRKCENAAKKSCEADSENKKLRGAAKNSHVKKCVQDTVGA